MAWAEGAVWVQGVSVWTETGAIWGSHFLAERQGWVWGAMGALGSTLGRVEV